MRAARRAPMTVLMRVTFLNLLGEKRKLGSYTDGGPRDDGRRAKRAVGKRQRQARQVQQAKARARRK